MQAGQRRSLGFAAALRAEKQHEEGTPGHSHPYGTAARLNLGQVGVQ